MNDVNQDTLREVQAAIYQLGQAESAWMLVASEPDIVVRRVGETTYFRYKERMDVLSVVTTAMDLKRTDINQGKIDDMAHQVKIAETATKAAEAKAKAAVTPPKSSKASITTPFRDHGGEARDTRTRLANTRLYSREQRQNFSYEDVARVQGNITKGIPNGYKDFDLDALMRTDKVDDRSQALQAVCLAVETTRRLEDKLIPLWL